MENQAKNENNTTGPQLVDSFIRLVNHDNTDHIHMTREQGCVLRDEIIRLRKIENKNDNK